MTEPNRAPHGPFNSLDEVFEAGAPMRAAVRHVDPDDTLSEDIRARWFEARVRFITDALTQCGVDRLGELDARTVRWIAASWDSEETTVVLDWLKRAYAAALAELPVYGSIEEMLDDLGDDAPADPSTLRHALSTFYNCGADGATVAFGSDVTCPKCLALMAAENGGAQ